MASNGLHVYHSVTPATHKVIQEASKLADFTPTPHSTAEDKKVWDKFVDYSRKRGFHPLEATEQDVLTWLEQQAQDTAAPATVQFELGCLQKWRYQAGKPLGPISLEAAISKGLLNYLDPSHSGIKSFKPHQLHKLLKRAVLQEKGCNFAALRQMSIYVLQFWGFARFVEVQSLKIGHFIRGIDHFDLVISRLKEGTARPRDVTQIYPTPQKYKKKPLVLLSSYQSIS